MIMLMWWLACAGAPDAPEAPDPVAAEPSDVEEQAPPTEEPAEAQATPTEDDAPRDPAPQEASDARPAETPPAQATPDESTTAATLDAPAEEAVVEAPGESSEDGLGTEAAEATEEEPAPSDPNPVRSYSWQPQRSFLAVLVRNDPNTMMSAMGHDHVIAASTFSGDLTWDADDPSACAVSIRFPVSALVVDPPGSRDRVGFEGDTPDGDRATITKNFSGKRQLDASHHPTISFSSTSCASQGERVAVTGALSIRGVSHTVTADMKIRQADADGFRATGKLVSAHSDFGMDPFAAMAGALKNQQKLEFRMDLRAK